MVCKRVHPQMYKYILAINIKYYSIIKEVLQAISNINFKKLTAL